MFDPLKAIIDLLSSKVGEFAGQLFWGFSSLLLVALLGFPFEKFREDFQVMAVLGICLTWPFAAKPIVNLMLPWMRSGFSALQKKAAVDDRIAKIRDYSALKKQILLVAFLAGKNHLSMADTQELAEMTADEVLEYWGGYYTVKYDLWKDLNARPVYRDHVLNAAELGNTVKSAIEKQKRERGFY
jgi:hypothetical protein